ncbi:MAG: replication-associated recombination protein A, partial [Planctomycetota bacterium]
PPSMLLWGPPGTGKTTIARLLARSMEAEFSALSAVTGGVADVKRAVATARELRRSGASTLLFVDEIHRFNRAQQDALLPHIEDGTVIFVGATTENPSFKVNSALLSRCRLVVLESLDAASLEVLLHRALSDAERGLGDRGLDVDADAVRVLVAAADGDARRLLGALEMAAAGASISGESSTVTGDLAADAVERALRYDRSGDQHYDTVSALQKSLRDGDPDAGLYWLVRMLEAGEDPLYVARRLVRIASEDVGLADPQALPLAMAARDAVHFMGMPEGGLALAEACIYLALAPKSNALETAWEAASRSVTETGSLPVPLHLRNAPTDLLRELGHGRGYRYAHDEVDGITGQRLFPEGMDEERYYVPRPRGFERDLERRLQWFRGRRAEVRGAPEDEEGTA